MQSTPVLYLLGREAERGCWEAEQDQYAPPSAPPHPPSSLPGLSHTLSHLLPLLTLLWQASVPFKELHPQRWSHLSSGCDRLETVTPPTPVALLASTSGSPQRGSCVLPQKCLPGSWGHFSPKKPLPWARGVPVYVSTNCMHSPLLSLSLGRRWGVGRLRLGSRFPS